MCVVGRIGLLPSRSIYASYTRTLTLGAALKNRMAVALLVRTAGDERTKATRLAVGAKRIMLCRTESETKGSNLWMSVGGWVAVVECVVTGSRRRLARVIHPTTSLLFDTTRCDGKGSSCQPNEGTGPDFPNHPKI